MDFLRQFDRETCVNVAQLIKLKSYVKQTDGDYQCYWMQPIRTIFFLNYKLNNN